MRRRARRRRTTPRRCCRRRRPPARAPARALARALGPILTAAAPPQATLLHNRWNVFTGAEPYVVWEVAPARLDDGSVVDLWRGTEQVAWAVPRGAAPAGRGGRWRSWPYLAERTAEADAAFWGALCDEWEARPAAAGRRVDAFVFYLLQADVVPFGAEPAAAGAEAGGGEAWPGYLPAYGGVRKRRIATFSCLERRRAREAEERQRG